MLTRNSAGCGFNIQCGWDANVDGGWWRVDVSIARGPLGDEQYWDCLGGTREAWIWDTECTTG
jgi:hypothetical protein